MSMEGTEKVFDKCAGSTNSLGQKHRGQCVSILLLKSNKITPVQLGDLERTHAIKCQLLGHESKQSHTKSLEYLKSL